MLPKKVVKMAFRTWIIRDIKPDRNISATVLLTIYMNSGSRYQSRKPWQRQFWNESIIFLFNMWRNELNMSCQNVENYAIFYLLLNCCELRLYINKTLNCILQAFPYFLGKNKNFTACQRSKQSSLILYHLILLS